MSFDKNHKRTRSREGARVQTWYKSERWKRESRAFLEAHPLCQCPHCREGKGQAQARESNIVHHSQPHKGNRKLFWDKSNWLAYNKQCHDTFAQSQERGGHGFMKGGDERGYPLNPNHPFNQVR